MTPPNTFDDTIHLGPVNGITCLRAYKHPRILAYPLLQIVSRLPIVMVVCDQLMVSLSWVILIKWSNMQWSFITKPTSTIKGISCNDRLWLTYVINQRVSHAMFVHVYYVCLNLAWKYVVNNNMKLKFKFRIIKSSSINQKKRSYSLIINSSYNLYQ